MYIVPDYVGKYNNRQPYTYLWLRDNGIPYYVGKGMGERAFKKRRLGNSPPRHRIIIQEFETENDALKAEKFLIALYGREDLGQGPLLNLTDGGDQPPSSKGLKRRPESIQKFVTSRSAGCGWKMLNETKEKIRLAHVGRPSANRGKSLPEETKRKISETLKRRKVGFTPGYVPWNAGKKYSVPCLRRPWTEARRAAMKKEGI